MESLLRALGAVLLVGATGPGCAQSIHEYLSERSPPDHDAEVPAPSEDAGATAGPEAVAVRRVPLSTVLEPRGLAHDGLMLFVTDRADDTLVRLDPESGRELERVALPARGALALTHASRVGLLVGYADGIYRYADDRFTRVADSVAGLLGLTAAEDAVVTAQPGALTVRDPQSLVLRHQLSYRGEPGLLVRIGDDYLIYQRSRRQEADAFTALFTVADATSATAAEVLGAVALPVDVARVTGLALVDDELWVVGSGQGADTAHVVVLTLAGETGR